MSAGTTNKWRNRAYAQVPWLILVIVLIALLVVPVQAALNPDFTGTPRSGVTPLNVQFNDTSTGPHDQWQWEFGDGNKSIEQKPLYFYNKPGSYTVTLIISNASEEQATIVQDNYITVDPPPAASELVLDFNGTPRSGVSPLTVQFNEASRGFVEPVTYLWDFGDGGASTERNPLYTYNQQGSHTVTLNISQSIGAPASIAKNKYITVESPLIPLLLNPDFTGIPRSGVTPLTVRFNDTSTGPHDQWQWEFGDGNKSIEQKPLYSYNLPGSYNVTLIISNSSGEQATIVQDNYITVNPAPAANELVLDFNGTPRSGVSPLTVQFNDASTGFLEPVTYLWDFGDGGTSTVRNPQYTYTQQGSHTITLNISQSVGAPASIAKNKYITVTSVPLLLPVADFFGIPTSGVAPLTVIFTDLSTNTPIAWNWSFGDDSPENATEQHPIHTYVDPGNYTVSVNATNANGSDSQTREGYIKVRPAAIPKVLPTADFFGIPTSGVAPLTVTFSDLSTETPTKWNWSFGDDSLENATIKNPVHTYTSVGNFTVSLNATNADGSDTQTRGEYITVNPAVVPPTLPVAAPPVTNFSCDPTSGVAPLTVTFSDLSTETPTKWNWSFGDDSLENATIKNPVHTYTSVGNFTVSLNATNANGSDTQTRGEYITVNPAVIPPTLPVAAPPVTNFSCDPTSGVAPLTVTFSDLSTETPTSWNWSFGDDSLENATVRNPVHTYANPGTFTVFLNASNAHGSDTKIWTDYITISAVPLVPLVPEPLIPNFTGTPLSGPAPLTVKFNDASTGLHDQWGWDFGDGNKSAEHNPQYTYNKPGSYSIILNISQAGGERATITHHDYITVVTPLIPVPLNPTLLIPNFTGMPASGPAPLTVQFDDTSTGPHDQWVWEFGDGNTSAEHNPLYTYNKPGSFNVTLNISQAGGEPATITHLDFITVSAVPLAPPVADFSGKPISGIAPLTVTFSDLSSNTPTSWNWSFGDDSKENATEQNPVHTYTSAGNYTVSLNATNADGSDTKILNDYITVSAVPLAPPVADFSGKPISGIAPLTVTFSDLSSNTPTSWNWSFGDDSKENATEQNPVHTYTSAGNYTVSLNATNAAGLNITTKMNYINVTAVLAAPVADFSGTPTSGRSPLTVQFNDTSTGFVSPITYFWNFGDGFNSTERNPTHTYSPSTPENYTVSLNVTGNYGKTDEMIKSGYITIEIPTIELIISNELQPDLSLPPEQSLPQAQSLPQGKSSLQAQSLSPSTLAHQDQSLPQDTPSQNDLSAQWIGGVWVPNPEIDWTLTKGENTINNAFTMWVWSNEDWKVMVRDSDSNGKPNDLKGKMVEYDYSTTPPHYVLNGKNLTQHLNVKSGGNSYVQLSGENQQIQTGTTDVIWLWVYQIGLKQSVENSDTSLGSNRRYRIEITFEATTAA